MIILNNNYGKYPLYNNAMLSVQIQMDIGYDNDNDVWYIRFIWTWYINKIAQVILATKAEEGRRSGDGINICMYLYICIQ